MKKYIIFAALLLTVLMVFSSCSDVELPDGEMTAVFKYGDADINVSLSDEDASAVRKMFDKKSLFSDTPSCSFSEDVALVINSNIYCVACDTCGIIFDVENDKYFSLSDSENEALRSMLHEYGFVFPCI